MAELVPASGKRHSLTQVMESERRPLHHSRRCMLAWAMERHASPGVQNHGLHGTDSGGQACHGT